MSRFRLSESWRKFLREVGIIVLGVLIALGIGELADDLRWRSRTADSNAAIDVELARAAGVLDERSLLQPCLNRRLEEVSRLIRAARAGGSLPEIRDIAGGISRPIATAAWEESVASGTILHMSAERRAMLSVQYPLLRSYPDAVRAEGDLWARLRILEGVPGPVSDTILTEAAVSVSRLQAQSRFNGLNAQQIGAILSTAGVRPSYFTVLDREGSRREVVAFLRTLQVCHPLAGANAS